MSSPFANSGNPYAGSVLPPEPMPVLPGGPLQSQLDYMRMYNYIFENPGWMNTVLLLGLTMLAAIIPGVSIILQLLFVGYQFETIDWLLKSQGRQYQSFEFGRIGDYFGRGLWPFLVSFVATMVLVGLVYLGLGIGVFGISMLVNALGDDIGAIVGMLLGAVFFVVFVVALFACAFYLTAITIRSGLAQEFAAGFQLEWLNDFVSKMWKDMVVGGLFLMASAFVLEILGMLALCIGLLFVIPIIMLAHAHLLYQLYVIYLSRGGIPVVMKRVAYGGVPQPPLAPPPPMPPGYPPKPPA